MLNAFVYEITAVHGRNNRYFVGDRTFELPEVQVLLHAVGAAKFFTERTASVLTEKVAELLGEAQADRLKELLTVESDEFDNERIYYSIDAITTALMKKKKLSFRYFDYDSNGEKVYRKDKERYEVNPLGMVYSGENFYLVCFHDKYGDPASYRIDKMDDARAEKSKRSDWFVRKGKNRTAQKVKQLLGAIFSLAVEDNEFKNPMTKIKLPHYEVKKGTPLSKEEEKRLIEFCKTNSHLYGVSAILILLYTGMRVGELPSMTMRKTDSSYSYIECETEKIRKGYAAVRRKISISPMKCILEKLIKSIMNCEKKAVGI